MMSGAAKIMANGQELHDERAYFQAQEILIKLVQAEPRSQVAKELLAVVLEQIG